MASRLYLLFNAYPGGLISRSRASDSREKYAQRISTILDFVSGATFIVGLTVAILALADRTVIPGSESPYGPPWWILSVWWLGPAMIGLASWILRLFTPDSGQVRLWVLQLSILRFCVSIAFLVFARIKPKHVGPMWFFVVIPTILNAIFRLLASLCSYFGFALFKWIGDWFGIRRIKRADNWAVSSQNDAWNRLVHKRMAYLDPQQTSQLRDSAEKQMKGGSIDLDTAWYHPVHRPKKRNGRTKGAPATPKTRLLDPEDPGAAAPRTMGALFSKCYCCFGVDIWDWKRAVPPARLKVEESKGNSSRTEFLNRKQTNHLGVRFEGYSPHKLCGLCENLCERSELIQLANKLEKKREHKRENWLHYPTPADLKRSAEDCHFCTIMWSLLSSEQQSELLEIDHAIEIELNEALAKSEGKSSKQEDTRKLFRQRRSIGIRIESANGRSWTSASAEDVDRASGPSLLWFGHTRIIPHYGEFRIPRRWLPLKSASRAISMGRDPATVWHWEQVDAIYLTPPSVNYTPYKTSRIGPIVLPLSNSTSSEEAMEFIRILLNAHEQCHNHASHSRCQTPNPQEHREGVEMVPLLPATTPVSQTEFLPTRLIDVNMFEDRVCVRDKASIKAESLSIEGHHKGVKYLALSHCWGNKPEFLVLNRETRDDVFNGISISRLAQTFQDAIYVARRLGVRYLWIDSLCIIQDSDEDWRCEAMTMKDVYTYAECVIAAIAPWDSSMGLFVKQNPLAMSPCLLRVNAWENHRYQGVYAIPAKKYIDYSWQDDIFYSRLRSRAWCFQEEQLAKKVVYFGPHQIFFLCKSSSPDEKDYITSQVGCSPWLPHRKVHHVSGVETTGWEPSVGLNHEKVRSKLRKPSLLPTLSAANTFDPSRIWAIYQTWSHISKERAVIAGSLASDLTTSLDPLMALEKEWWDIIAEYTSRFLTKPKDKLIAVEGVAGNLSTKRESQTYIYGLWEPQQFPMGLLWYVDRPRPLPAQHTGLSPAQAPSWSWASVMGTVKNNSYVGAAATSGITVARVDQEPTWPCKLQLVGRISLAKWGECPATEPRYYRGHQRYQDEVVSKGGLAHYFPCTRDPNSGPEVKRLLNSDGRKVGWLVPDQPGRPLPEEVCCLRIVVEPVDVDMKNDFGVPWATRGLVLVPTGNNIVGEYNRVGYFELERKDGGLKWPTIFTGPLSSRDSRLPVRQPGPDIDVHGFFDGCIDEHICII